MPKNIKFRKDGIIKLPEKWQKVVEQNSDTLCNKVLSENEKNVSLIQNRRNFLANQILHISEEREISTRDNQTVLAYPRLRGFPGYGNFHANTRIASGKPGQISPESFFLLT